MAGAVVVVAGIVLLIVAWLSRVERLPRNHFVGIRLRSTMRSDAAWAPAHRATWSLTAAAGAITSAWGLWLLLDATATDWVWVMVLSVSLLLVTAAIRGHRIAQRVNESEVQGIGR